MLWTPGPEAVPALQPLNANQLESERQLRQDVAFLAGSIGERNIPGRPQQLEAAARFIDRSLQAAGYRAESQSYKVGGIACRNIEAAIRGTGRPQDVVILGAHYDTVPGSPGADDSASGVATVHALARHFAGTDPARTLRFVGFANEEPPYFWTGDMGSLVYARKCKQAGDHIVAMLSIESVGFYSVSRRASTTRPGSACSFRPLETSWRSSATRSRGRCSTLRLGIPQHGRTALRWSRCAEYRSWRRMVRPLVVLAARLSRH